jgi:hypothetical protein
MAEAARRNERIMRQRGMPQEVAHLATHAFVAKPKEGEE